MERIKWSKLGRISVSAFVALALAACSGASGTKSSPKPADAAPQGNAPAQTAPAPAPEKPLTKVKIAYLEPGSAFLPVHVGVASGTYKKHGLDVEMVKLAISPSLAALERGDVQFNMIFGSTIASILQGAPLKIVSVLAEKPNFYVVASKKIPNLDALKQRLEANQPVKMGASSVGGSDDLTIRDMLLAKGFSKELVARIKTIPMPEDAVQDASLEQGLLELVINSPPSPFRLQEAGYPVLLTPKDAAFGSPSSALVVTKKFQAEQPDVVKAMVAGTVDAMQFMKQNKDATTKVMQEWMGGNAQAAELGYRSLLDVLSMDGASTWETLEKVKQQRRASAKLQQDMPVAEIFDFAPVWEAQKKLGLPQRPAGNPK